MLSIDQMRDLIKKGNYSEEKHYSYALDNLITRKTVEELEAEHTYPEVSGKPFGDDNDRWEALKAKIHPGDELWTFCTSKASWAALAGRAGIVLLRDGKVVDKIITMMS